MQIPPRFLFDGWSDRIKLYPAISKLPSSYAVLETRYVSEIHTKSNFWDRYKLLRVKFWHSYEPLCCSSVNIWTFSQLCLLVNTTSRRGTTSNQRWNNVVYFNVAIYNVEQRRMNVVYFNVDVNNVRQRWNNVVIFNVEFHNVGKRRNNVVKMTISKKNKKIFPKKYTELKVLATFSMNIFQ